MSSDLSSLTPRKPERNQEVTCKLTGLGGLLNDSDLFKERDSSVSSLSKFHENSLEHTKQSELLKILIQEKEKSKRLEEEKQTLREKINALEDEIYQSHLNNNSLLTELEYMKNFKFAQGELQMKLEITQEELHRYISINQQLENQIHFLSDERNKYKSILQTNSQKHDSQENPIEKELGDLKLMYEKSREKEVYYKEIYEKSRENEDYYKEIYEKSRENEDYYKEKYEKSRENEVYYKEKYEKSRENEVYYKEKYECLKEDFDELFEKLNKLENSSLEHKFGIVIKNQDSLIEELQNKIKQLKLQTTKRNSVKKTFSHLSLTSSFEKKSSRKSFKSPKSRKPPIPKK